MQESLEALCHPEARRALKDLPKRHHNRQGHPVRRAGFNLGQASGLTIAVNRRGTCRTCPERQAHPIPLSPRDARGDKGGF